MCKVTYTRGSMTRVSIFIITAIAYHQYMYKCTHTYLPPAMPVCVRERESMCEIIHPRVSMTRVSIFIIITIAYHQYMYKCTCM